MNCTRCGNPLRPDAAFCDRCGEPTREGKPSRTRILVVMVLAVALFVVLALIGVRGLLGSGNGSDASGASTSTSGGTAPGTQSTTGSPAPTTAPGKTPTSAVSLPSGATACPEQAGATATLGTWTGSKRTSCAFALAVRDAYAAATPSAGKATVRAKSPVTGKTYTMTCTGSQPVICKGGDDAVVYLAT